MAHVLAPCFRPSHAAFAGAWNCYIERKFSQASSVIRCLVMAVKLHAGSWSLQDEYLVTAICSLGNEEALKATMLAQLCVQSLLVLPLLCQIANEQSDLQIAQYILEATFAAMIASTICV